MDKINWHSLMHSLASISSSGTKSSKRLQINRTPIGSIMEKRTIRYRQRKDPRVKIADVGKAVPVASKDNNYEVKVLLNPCVIDPIGRPVHGQ